MITSIDEAFLFYFVFLPFSFFLSRHYFCFRWLKFIAPLTAHLQPQLQTVDVDRDAEFQCIVSGHPVHDIKWLHDGKPILRDNRIEV